MKMGRLFCAFSTMLVLGVLVAPTWADGRISAGTLGEMGLEGMTILSDEDATAIRGFGYSHSNASVYGHSWANVRVKGGSAGSVNGYKANGKHSAVGANLSFAAIEVKKSGGRGPKGNHRSKGGKGGRYGGGGHGGGGGGYGGKPHVTSIRAVAGGASFAKVK